MDTTDGAGQAHHVSVLGIGWLVHDSVMLLDRFPDEDTKTEAVAHVEQPGGPVPRALSVVARLGPRVQLAAMAGRDEAGQMAVRTLDKRGVATDHVELIQGCRTNRSQVWINQSSGSRTIAYSNAGLPSLDVDDAVRSLATEVDVLHLDGRELTTAIEVADLCAQSGTTIVVDAGGWKPDLERLLALADVVVVSQRVLTSIRQTDARRGAHALLTDLALDAVVVTAGSAGTSLVRQDSVEHIPANPVQAVDTNGAGDVFCGGLIYGILRSWPLSEAVRFASRVAAISCQHFGDYLPSLSEVTGDR